MTRSARTATHRQVLKASAALAAGSVASALPLPAIATERPCSGA